MLISCLLTLTAKTPHYRQVGDELAFDAIAEHGLINLVSENESEVTSLISSVRACS